MDENNKEELNIEQLDDISKLNIFDSPLSKDRIDRGVRVKDKNNKEMRTSNIMLGKQKVEFNNGDYLSLEEAKEAVKKYLEEASKNNKTIISKRTGKKVDINEVLESLSNAEKKDIGIIYLEEKEEKITNQDTKKVKLKGSNEEEANHKGTFMLGNKGIELTPGVYIEKAEIIKALEEYMLKSYKPPVVPPSPGPSPEPQIEEIYRVKRTKRKYPIAILIPLIIAATMAINTTDAEVMIKSNPTTIANIVAETGYEKAIEINDEEAYEKVLSELDTGGKIYIDKGTTYHESSDYEYDGANKKGVFGEGIRNEGEYTLEYISIVNNKTGEIIKVEYKENNNIGDFINKALKENNLSLNDVEVLFHIGGPVSGWINAKDLNTLIENNKKTDETEFVIDNQYKATENNFTSTVTIELETGEKVTINLLDKEGNIIKEGTIVTGSDGIEYRITNINIEETINKETTATIKAQKNSLEDKIKSALIASGIAMALSAAYAEITKEKEKHIVSKEEYEKAEKEFNKNSLWGKLLSKIGKIRAKAPNIETTKEEYSKENIKGR